MKNFIGTYYCVQVMKTHESTWLAPKSKLKKVSWDEWMNCGSYWYKGLDPWNKEYPHQDNYKHKYEESHKNWYALKWIVDREYCWSAVNFAIEAMKRCTKLDKLGEFDSYDSYGHHNQAVRHKFRVVRYDLTYNLNCVVLE